MHMNSVNMLLLSVMCWLLSLSRLTEGSLFYTGRSSMSIIAAVAVPLDLPNKHVFVSYNFGANYGLPMNWKVPPILDGVEDEDLDIERQFHDCANCTQTQTAAEDNTTEASTITTKKITPKPTSKAEVRERRSLLTRTHFYKILIHKFERKGFQGEPCLLRLICETNGSILGDINGVLGNLIHVLLSPSTSMNEHLPVKYYQAEVDGRQEQCEHYAGECTTNIIDFISKPLNEIVNTIIDIK